LIRFAHIVNPVAVPATHELFRAQPITFESMRQAKLFAESKVDVALLSVQYEEDKKSVPDYFKILPDLNQSIREVANLPNAKKFPLIADILKLLYEHSDAEYLIYTNIDIILVPQFYVAIAALIQEEGYDAISVNRRRIPFAWNTNDKLSLIQSQMGKPHPGYDCFVFHRSLFLKFIFSNVCIGTGYTSVAFIHNLIAFSTKPLITDKLHLTLHLGLEVMPPLDQSIYRFTRNDYEQNIYPKLKPYFQLNKFPYSTLCVYKRVLKWLLNPNFSTQIMIELEGKNFKRKLKGLIDEVRFALLGNT